MWQLTLNDSEMRFPLETPFHSIARVPVWLSSFIMAFVSGKKKEIKIETFKNNTLKAKSIPRPIHAIVCRFHTFQEHIFFTLENSINRVKMDLFMLRMVDNKRPANGFSWITRATLFISFNFPFEFGKIPNNEITMSSLTVEKDRNLHVWCRCVACRCFLILISLHASLNNPFLFHPNKGICRLNNCTIYPIDRHNCIGTRNVAHRIHIVCMARRDTLRPAFIYQSFRTKSTATGEWKVNLDHFCRQQHIVHSLARLSHSHTNTKCYTINSKLVQPSNR